MNIVFRLELDQGPKSPHDPACLEISRVGQNIHFSIIDGVGSHILQGRCEPTELLKLSTMLGEE